MEKIGGRKFLLTIVILFIGAAIELKTEHGLSTNFVTFLLGILGVFTAGNSAVSWVYSKNGTPPAVEPDEPENTVVAAPIIDNTVQLEEIKNKIEETEKLLTLISTTTLNTQKLLGAALVKNN